MRLDSLYRNMAVSSPYHTCFPKFVQYILHNHDPYLSKQNKLKTKPHRISTVNVLIICYFVSIRYKYISIKRYIFNYWLCANCVVFRAYFLCSCKGFVLCVP